MSFIEKNLHSVTEVIQNALFAEQTAKYSGLLQKLDPRTKIICFIIIILSINLSRNLFYILSIYFIVLILAYFSKLPIKLFITRVWLFLPFFTGLIAIPAIFNIFSPGKPLLVILDIQKYKIYLSVTENGLLSAIFLLVRVATSVSLASILVLTTDWIQLLKAFEKLKFPQILVVISLMTYRYIYILLKTANNIFLARQSRKLNKMNDNINRVWVANTLGMLFNKTQNLSEDVYEAMKSRGFKNKVHISNNFVFKRIDYYSLLICMGFVITAIYICK
jgi:cobalt/nickel transport system permease protein